MPGIATRGGARRCGAGATDGGPVSAVRAAGEGRASATSSGAAAAGMVTLTFTGTDGGRVGPGTPGGRLPTRVGGSLGTGVGGGFTASIDTRGAGALAGAGLSGSATAFHA